nr:MAG TPA: hypothetical protein [Caudoviricetes sp.]
MKRLQHFGCWSLARCRMVASLLCYMLQESCHEL